MKKGIPKKIVIVGVTALLVSQLFVGQAFASWGAAKLLELNKLQNTSTPTVSNPLVTTPSVSQTNLWYVPPAEPKTSVTGEMSQEEILMLQLVNDERKKNGLKPLEPMPELNKLAQLKSEDIITNNYFSHISPVYGSFAKMIYDNDIYYRSAGENLAKARNARHAFVLFMASSGHKANILSRNFTNIGIGVVPYKYGVVVTQLFIRIANPR